MNLVESGFRGSGYPHKERILECAKKCTTILECGCGSMSATWALVLGMMMTSTTSVGTSNNFRYYGIDLTPNIHVGEQIQKLCSEEGISFEIFQSNNLYFDQAQFLSSDIDLLFIDTSHIYGQLIRELSQYQSRIRKYILIPNSQVDKWYGENLREGGRHPNSNSNSNSNWSRWESQLGMFPAIVEFCETHPQWQVQEHIPQQYGLTILQRIMT